MNPWLGQLRAGCAGLLIAALLAGCDGDGFDPEIFRVFFGTNGAGACTVVEVDVDLEGAILNVPDRHNPDCVLSTDLKLDGCEADFDLTDERDFLRVTVSGCTIPAVTELFHCGFFAFHLDDLQAGADTDCSCANPGCDRVPPLCVSQVQDPGSCEVCSNGRDDDGNGRVDCEDPNCRHFPTCEGSATSTSTSSTVSHTLPETTSTTLASLPTYKIRFSFLEAVTVGSLEWSTDYSTAFGDFAGDGADVQCVSLVENALSAFNDFDAEMVLRSGLISVDGFTGPLDVVECTFRSAVAPTQTDFVISNVLAAAPDLTPIVSPEVGVGSIVPDATTTTTLSEVTTTTLSEVTTTTTVTTAAATVRFRLESASAGVGAIQFGVDYSAAGGEFLGSGSAVQCTNLAAGTLFAPNDDEATDKLTLGVISLTELSAPIDLVDCVFGSTVPAADDFQVTIEDATDGDGTLIDVAVGVIVTPLP